MAKEEGEKVAKTASAVKTKPAAKPATEKAAKNKDAAAKPDKKAVKKTVEKKPAKGGKADAKKATKAKETKKAKPAPRASRAVKVEEAPTIFRKAGQKHITPPKGDGTRGFYESLYEANPRSIIAIVYCVEYGLFGGLKHQELLEQYQELRKEGLLKGGNGGVRPLAVKFLDKFNAKSKAKAAKASKAK